MPKKLPFKVAIQQPCEQSWTSMVGSHSKRHCDSCNKNVHDFASLTPGQIEYIVQASRGDLCARLTHRDDGSLVTVEADRVATSYAGWVLSATLALTAPTAQAQVDAGTTQGSPQAAKTPETDLPRTHTAVIGVITDSQGALVFDSTVTLLLNGHPIGSTKTSSTGQFEFAVAPGDYQLQVVAPSFAVSSKSLTVTPEKATIADVVLTPGVQVTVQVTTQSLTDSTTMGTLVANLGPWYKTLGYRLRHPITYARYLFHAY